MVMLKKLKLLSELNKDQLNSVRLCFFLEEELQVHILNMRHMKRGLQHLYICRLLTAFSTIISALKDSFGQKMSTSKSARDKKGYALAGTKLLRILLITGAESGRTPRHVVKDSAACSTSMPNPSNVSAAL